jgi:hypothetical protein
MLEPQKVNRTGAGTPRFALSADPLNVVMNEYNNSIAAASLKISLNKSGSNLQQGFKVTSFDEVNIKRTSCADLEKGEDLEEEGDEDEELYGAPQTLAKQAPKKSIGGMSRMSKNSTASSDRGERMNELFVMPFIRAATRFNESRIGRLLTIFLNRVTTKVFFWSFLSLINISVILLIFHWASGELS